MQEYKISLITTSLNNDNNLIRLFNSLNNQTIPKEYFEIILIDQSNNTRFHYLIDQFKHLQIKYFVHNIDSLSKIRNYGILNSKGNILAFPDDDCWYYPTTLNDVLFFFNSSKQCNSLTGRIYDTKNKKNIVKKWPIFSTKINKFNYYFLSSATTLFTKNKILFNEKLGPKTKFGSCEDVQFFYDLLKFNNFYYSPTINVMHPDMIAYEKTLTKSYNYGMGFGYFIRNNFNLFNFILYILSLSYLISRMLFNLFSFKFNNAKSLFSSLKGRIFGFFNP